MTELPLRGRRIVLRDWTADDLPALEHWFQPGRVWRALDGPYYQQASTSEMPQQLAPFRRAIEATELPTPRVSIAIATADDDALVGRVSRYWQSEETLWLSLGVGVYDPEQWGRGIGYEALGLWSQYVLDAMPDLARLDLRTWSGNPRMMRLAERLGYRLEARFRDARIVDGTHFDAMGYGTLRAEWSERYPGGFAASLDA